MEDKGNISIFQGSAVEADTIHDFLARNDIGALVRNHMQENLDAGWLTAEPDHAAEVFVAREDQAKAEDLLKNLYHEQGSELPGASSVQHGPAAVTKQPINSPDRKPGSPPPTHSAGQSPAGKYSGEENK